MGGQPSLNQLRHAGMPVPASPLARPAVLQPSGATRRWSGERYSSGSPPPRRCCCRRSGRGRAVCAPRRDALRRPGRPRRRAGRADHFKARPGHGRGVRSGPRTGADRSELATAQRHRGRTGSPARRACLQSFTGTAHCRQPPAALLQDVHSHRAHSAAGDTRCIGWGPRCIANTAGAGWLGLLFPSTA